MSEKCRSWKGTFGNSARAIRKWCQGDCAKLEDQKESLKFGKKFGGCWRKSWRHSFLGNDPTGNGCDEKKVCKFITQRKV
jgi:hypothetical protein